MLSFADYKDRISKSVHYHIENNIPFAENIYRVHSEEFYKLFREARNLYNEGLLTELYNFEFWYFCQRDVKPKSNLVFHRF